MRLISDNSLGAEIVRCAFRSVALVIRVVFNGVNALSVRVCARSVAVCRCANARAPRYSVCGRLKCQRGYGRRHLLLAINECVVLRRRLYEKQTGFLERVLQYMAKPIGILDFRLVSLQSHVGESLIRNFTIQRANGSIGKTIVIDSSAKIDCAMAQMSEMSH